MKRTLSPRLLLCTLVLVFATNAHAQEHQHQHADTTRAMPMDHGGMMDMEHMHAMMPQHRQMVANMLARMNREMQEMNMASDTAWSATVDSLRQDLTRMPEMNAEELHASMPEHRRRSKI